VVRSTQNLLRHGWPVFDCGGFYTRGLILQYLAALFAQLGIPLNVAPRLISAVSSLFALPAVFVLGRRMHSRTFGLVAVVVLALSVWETEIGRFGRMYAPFQAVFLWYLVFFLRRAVDRDPRADYPMIILTVVGTLLWEGGVFLAFANFLPIFLQKRSAKLLPRDWAALAGFAVICVAAYWFVTTDFRVLGGAAPLPLDYDSSVTVTTATPPNEPPSLWIVLSVHRVWLVLFLLPLALSAWAARIAWLRRETVLSAAALTAALAAAVAHQFLAAGAVLTLASVFRFASWAQLTSGAARIVYSAIGICALFWLSFVSAVWVHPTDGPLWKAALSFVYPLVSLPDLLNQVIRPWASAVPALSVGLLLLVGAAVGHLMRQDEPGISNERAVTAVFVCMLLAACASDTPRHETRYVFFLYPIALLIALMTVDRLVRMSTRHARASVLMTPIVGLGLFMLSEDFNPRHLLTIDQPATIFRHGMTAAQESHLVTRDDTPALAQWLRHHAASGDVVVSAYQSLEYYYPKTEFFYVERSDYNFESYACRYGTVDRWSNRPLLQSAQALATLISGTSTTYLVTYSARVEQLIEHLSRYHPSVEWQEGHLAVLAFDARTQTPRSP
jgi:Dolichyl-phosphate-mannose-protein mannosyltransferase